MGQWVQKKTKSQVLKQSPELHMLISLKLVEDLTCNKDLGPKMPLWVSPDTPYVVPWAWSNSGLITVICYEL